MRRLRLSGLLLMLLAVVAMVAAGCGGGDEAGSSGNTQNKSPAKGKQSGKLTYLAAADVD